MIIHDVEQGTPAWFALRQGRPTASEFSNIVTSKGDASKSMPTYAATLAGEMFANQPLEGWEGNQWSDRGKELEPDALALYSLVNDVAVDRVGFVTTDDGDMGCSPDALVGDDGMAEIKCLKAERHIKAILYYKKNGRCPTDYVQQTQGQMLIAERAWCDLIFYHPVLPLLVIRQTPDDVVTKALVEQIPLLIKERDAIHTVLVDQHNG